jgi:hypothetical protein
MRWEGKFFQQSHALARLISIPSRNRKWHSGHRHRLIVHAWEKQRQFPEAGGHCAPWTVWPGTAQFSCISNGFDVMKRRRSKPLF